MSSIRRTLIYTRDSNVTFWRIINEIIQPTDLPFYKDWERTSSLKENNIRIPSQTNNERFCPAAQYYEKGMVVLKEKADKITHSEP